MSAHAAAFSADEAMPELADQPRSLWRDAWARLGQSKVPVICLGVVGLYLIVALLTLLPVFARTPDSAALAAMTPEQRKAAMGLIWRVHSENYQEPTLGRGPSLWLGTNIAGQSVLWRVIYGTRTAMVIAAAASAISIVIGATLGLLAGFLGKWVDALVLWLVSTFSAVPWVLLVIAFTFVLRGYQNEQTGEPAIDELLIVILALGLTSWVSLCRLVRAEVLKIRERDFVMASRALGAGNGRILSRHVLPNVFHLIIIDFSLNAVVFVQAEVVLSFLGLGISDKPSWGRMIDDAKLELLVGVWWQFVPATAAIFIFCLAVNLLGDALRDALDPRLRGAD